MSDEKGFEQKVTESLDEIRTMLQSHGGDCELVGFDGKVVKLRLQGACRGCPGARMTLKMGIEQRLKEKIPELEEVVAVD